MSNQPPKIFICYKTDHECYRIRADDYQMHEGFHKFYLLDYLVSTFPIEQGWVIMPEDLITDETKIVDLIESWEKYKRELTKEDYSKKLEELIKIWWDGYRET